MERVFAARVREERERRGWSQATLAGKLAEAGLTLHSTAITRIESGERGVSLDDAATIAEVFGLSVSAMTASAAGADLATFLGWVDVAYPRMQQDARRLVYATGRLARAVEAARSDPALADLVARADRVLAGGYTPEKAAWLGHTQAEPELAAEDSRAERWEA